MQSVLIPVLALALAASPAFVIAQAVDMKTGAWEMTMKGSAMPRPMVFKTCVTKADLAELARGPDRDDDADCKLVKPPTVSSRAWSADKMCSNGMLSHMEFTSESPTKVQGTIVNSGARSAR